MIAPSSGPEGLESDTIVPKSDHQQTHNAYASGHMTVPVPSARSVSGRVKRVITARKQSRPRPALIRSENGSGLVRHHDPSTPKGHWAIMPSCDHQQMQTHVPTATHPLHTILIIPGQTFAVPYGSQPPESGQGPVQFGPVLRTGDEAGLDWFGDAQHYPRGDRVLHYRSEATGTYNT